MENLKTENIELTPSLEGKDCLGNGKHKDIECMCDECDYFLVCFPEWDINGFEFKKISGEIPLFK